MPVSISHDKPAVQALGVGPSILSSPFTFRLRPHTRRLIVHESHTGPSVRRAVDYLRAKGRANGLLEVGYHAVIERDGTWTTTRPYDRMGSHAAGANHDSIGVCLAGHDDWSSVEEEGAYLTGRMVTLMALHNFLIPTYGNLPVFGHDEVVRRRPTVDHPRCPSINMDWLRSYLGASNATHGHREADSSGCTKGLA